MGYLTDIQQAFPLALLVKKRRFGGRNGIHLVKHKNMPRLLSALDLADLYHLW
jgi:hypothetical protein